MILRLVPRTYYRPRAKLNALRELKENSSQFWNELLGLDGRCIHTDPPSGKRVAMNSDESKIRDVSRAACETGPRLDDREPNLNGPNSDESSKTLLAAVQVSRYDIGMSKKPASVTDQLRVAIVNGDETRYALSQRTGVSESVLSRFVNGATLTSDNLDALCEALGLELKPKRSRKGK